MYCKWMESSNTMQDEFDKFHYPTSWQEEDLLGNLGDTDLMNKLIDVIHEAML